MGALISHDGWPIYKGEDDSPFVPVESRGTTEADYNLNRRLHREMTEMQSVIGKKNDGESAD